MAKLSELVDVTAHVLGRDKGTVTLAARHLREAGMISSGGRGPGAANMTPTDAANLLIGLLGSEQVKDAPIQVAYFRRSILNYDGARQKETRAENEDGSVSATYAPVDLGELAFLNYRGALLGDTLDGLLTLAAVGTLEDYLVRLGLEGDAQAQWEGGEEKARRLVRAGMGYPLSIEFQPYSFAAAITLRDYWSGYGNGNFLINAGFVASEEGLEHAAVRLRDSLGDERLIRGCGTRTILALGALLDGKTA